MRKPVKYATGMKNVAISSASSLVNSKNLQAGISVFFIDKDSPVRLSKEHMFSLQRKKRACKPSPVPKPARWSSKEMIATWYSMRGSA
jgi:hypothetical protein